MFSGRSKNLDLSELKVLVIDEADCFFIEHNSFDEILRFKKVLESLKRPIQYLLFSATYVEDVYD
jgi:superfamily II DNA/RNA helicase